MPRASQEHVRPLLEIFYIHPGVRCQDAGCQRPHLGVVPSVMLRQGGTQPAVVALVGRFPGLAPTQVGLRLRHLHETAKDEIELDRHRLLAPQGAVVVEHRHALLHPHGNRSPFPTNTFDELDDGMPGRAVPPTRQQFSVHVFTCPVASSPWRKARCRGMPASGFAGSPEDAAAGGSSAPSAHPRSAKATATSIRAPPSAANGTITGSLPDRLTYRAGRLAPNRRARRPPPTRSGTGIGPLSRL